jgi:hypothetical protein
VPLLVTTLEGSLSIINKSLGLDNFDFAHSLLFLAAGKKKKNKHG